MSLIWFAAGGIILFGIYSAPNRQGNSNCIPHHKTARWAPGIENQVTKNPSHQLLDVYEEWGAGYTGLLSLSTNPPGTRGSMERRSPSGALPDSVCPFSIQQAQD